MQAQILSTHGGELVSSALLIDRVLSAGLYTRLDEEVAATPVIK
ncbi:hypothetical protein [Candidatus Nitronereus thalassa]|uniref:Uncharacterized protein n=1 Tax=Candidatus Nitronereus thalassa TaxID=3020898 RepID=A0ABU3KAT0_9BACT|nr:hypothetical protein [Candidatus Nitronereus thalassa]MDT7043492.1 hypothetical protein [Candidatus Nitronereus thalassa]